MPFTQISGLITQGLGIGPGRGMILNVIATLSLPNKNVKPLARNMEGGGTVLAPGEVKNFFKEVKPSKLGNQTIKADFYVPSRNPIKKDTKITVQMTLDEEEVKKVLSISPKSNVSIYIKGVPETNKFTVKVIDNDVKSMRDAMSVELDNIKTGTEN